MCEYCGCQEIVSIAVLTAEHDAVRVIASELLRTLAADELQAPGKAAHDPVMDSVQGPCVRLLELLVPHTQVEEHGLFAVMAAEFPDHVAALEAEHRLIEPALAAAAAREHPPGWRQTLTDALLLLTRHILTEQDGLFPASLISLGSEDWLSIESVRARVGCALVTAPG